MLEKELRSDNAFVTLTYAEETLPAGASLNKKDYQNFLKRLRFAMGSHRLRYFICGEYGDQGGRPHYHAVLFGYPQCRNGNTKRDLRGKPTPDKCCSVCRTLHSCWGLGLIDNGEITLASARYVSGYVTKKMTHRHHPWLNGRDPEFARMSLKPGLGYDMMFEVASTLMQFNCEASCEGDVPVTLAHGKTQMPLGRYLRAKLRLMSGLGDKVPEAVSRANTQKLHTLYKDALRDPSFVSIATHLSAMDDGAVANMEAKARIFKKRNSL